MRKTLSALAVCAGLASLPAYAAERTSDPTSCAPRVACQSQAAKSRPKPADPARSACMEAARLEAALLLLDPDVDWFGGRCPGTVIPEQEDDDDD